jgi:hypothetical protein
VPALVTGSTSSVNHSMNAEFWNGFSFLSTPDSSELMSWMTSARRTDSSVGVVIVSSPGSS